MLDVTTLRGGYDDVDVLGGLDLHVGASELVAVLGPNGAGKSSLLRAVVGLLPRRIGSVRLDGRELIALPPDAIARAGIALVPEGRRVFPGLTVYANLEVAATRWLRWRERVDEHVDAVLTLFPQLRARLRQRAWSLSGGEQQMLAIGRALMARPVLLLLDEPSLGLAPRLVDAVFDAIASIHRAGTPVLLVEQNVAAALGVAGRAYVMSGGAIVCADTADALRHDRQLHEAYLGSVTDSTTR
jgi:branched-chain amino acid transport system ATP-binding protein